MPSCDGACSSACNSACNCSSDKGLSSRERQHYEKMIEDLREQLADTHEQLTEQQKLNAKMIARLLGTE